MAFDIALGQFHNADSVIHRLDPRIKVTLLLVLFISAFCAKDFLGLGLLLLLLLITIALSAIHPLTVLKAVAPLCILLIFTIAINLFFTQEGVIFVQWGFISISDTGIYKALFMSLRFFTLLLSAVLLTLTTSPIALCDASASMLRPFVRFGLPAYEISMMISIALRFIPTLLEDLDHIRKAQQARGAVFDRGGPIARLKSLIPCFVPLFAQSFYHAEELALAMESRCYHGGELRTHYHILKIQNRDIAAIVICAADLGLIILSRWL